MPKKSKYSDRANEVIRKVLREMPPTHLKGMAHTLAKYTGSKCAMP